MQRHKRQGNNDARGQTTIYEKVIKTTLPKQCNAIKQQLLQVEMRGTNSEAVDNGNGIIALLSHVASPLVAIDICLTIGN